MTSNVVATEITRSITAADMRAFWQWLALELASTTAGIKPATILSFVNTRHLPALTIWRCVKDDLLTNGHLSFRIMKERPDRECAFFYQTAAMQACIMQPQQRLFLESQGYPVKQGLTACLTKLQARFADGCPHEIGIFLGIPLHDVLGFMGMSTLPRTGCYEWCTYGNPTISLQQMARFRSERQRVSALLERGCEARQLMYRREACTALCC